MHRACIHFCYFRLINVRFLSFCTFFIMDTFSWLTDPGWSSLPPVFVLWVCTSPPLPPPPRCLYSYCLAEEVWVWVVYERDGATPPSWLCPGRPAHSVPATQRRPAPEDLFLPPRCSEREQCGSSSSPPSSGSPPLPPPHPPPLRPDHHQRKWCWWSSFSSGALSSAQSLGGKKDEKGVNKNLILNLE